MEAHDGNFYYGAFKRGKVTATDESGNFTVTTYYKDKAMTKPAFRWVRTYAKNGNDMWEVNDHYTEDYNSETDTWE